jgi:hypothetical protein
VCPCGDAFLLGVVFDVRLMSDTLLYFCDAIIFLFFFYFFFMSFLLQTLLIILIPYHFLKKYLNFKKCQFKILIFYFFFNFNILLEFFVKFCQNTLFFLSKK